MRSVHGERQLTRRGSGDCTQRVGVVQLCRISRISPRVRLGEISRRLLALTRLALGKPPIWAFPVGLLIRLKRIYNF
jgi:hypothetical protein